MNVAAMIGMYRRRGSVLGWMHAQPIAEQDVDPLTQGPKGSLGGDLVDGHKKGPFGETFFPETNIWGYTTGKLSNTLLSMGGLVEAGDMELCTIVPFQPDLANGVAELQGDLADAYNRGQFVQLSSSKTLAAFDRFRFNGELWVAKARPRPIVDSNTVVGWRTLITLLKG